MKAFEEWWQKTGEHQRHLRFKNGFVLDKAYRSGVKDGWRAALEWVRDNEDAYCCGDCDAVDGWTECPKDTAIKQELGDE